MNRFPASTAGCRKKCHCELDAGARTRETANNVKQGRTKNSAFFMFFVKPGPFHSSAIQIRLVAIQPALVVTKNRRRSFDSTNRNTRLSCCWFQEYAATFTDHISTFHLCPLDRSEITGTAPELLSLLPVSDLAFERSRPNGRSWHGRRRRRCRCTTCRGKAKVP